MDLFTPRDEYCERIDSTLLSEPTNLFTNLGFILVALYAFFYLAPKVQKHQSMFKIFCLMVFCIGIGSGLYHSLANLWSMLADVLPITIFLFSFIIFYFAKIANFTWPKTFIYFSGYIVVTIGLAKSIPTETINNSNFYLGTLFMLFFLGIREYNRTNAFLLSGVFFFISLCFRGFDMAVCEVWPIGTHFLWHSFNSVTIFFTLLGAFKCLEYEK